jgi:hypothetical protein
MIKKSDKWYKRNCKDLWRNIIYGIFGHKCVVADQYCKGPINAHHIFSDKAHPATRYDTTNGVCLCFFHHRRVHDGRPDVTVHVSKHMDEVQFQQLRTKALSGQCKLDLPIIYEDLKQELGKYIC